MLGYSVGGREGLVYFRLLFELLISIDKIWPASRVVSVNLYLHNGISSFSVDLSSPRSKLEGGGGQ